MPSPPTRTFEPVSDPDSSQAPAREKSASWLKLAGYLVAGGTLVFLLLLARTGYQFHLKYGRAPDIEPTRLALAIPLQGVESLGIVSPYGAPREGGRRRHKGIDIFAPVGTPVLAPRPGTVEGRHRGRTAGKHIWLIDAEGRHAYLFLHLRRFAEGVGPGTRLEKGEILGYVGKTGNATRTPAHLHFGVARLHRSGTLAAGKRKVDPYPFLHANDREGAIRTLEALRTKVAIATHRYLGEEWWIPLDAPVHP